MRCNNRNYKEGYKPLGNNMDGSESYGGNKIHNIIKLATQLAGSSVSAVYEEGVGLSRAVYVIVVIARIYPA